jgi:VanZ family protein
MLIKRFEYLVFRVMTMPVSVPSDPYARQRPVPNGKLLQQTRFQNPRARGGIGFIAFTGHKPGSSIESRGEAALALGILPSYTSGVESAIVTGVNRGLPPRLKTWIPVIAWALLIFFASTSMFSAEHTGSLIEPVLRWLLPWASITSIEALHYGIRKLAHFTEFGVLFLLLIRGPMRGRAMLALTVCAIYAFTDEGHQMFVPDRTASLYDVALDFSGALFSHFLHTGFAELI